MARDPETGQFISDDTDAVPDFDLFDVQHFRQEWHIPAADNDGTTGATGGQSRTVGARKLMDAAGGLNRGWIADLIRLDVGILCWVNSTSTADGTVQAAVPISLGDAGDSGFVQSGTSSQSINNDFDKNTDKSGDAVDSDTLTILHAVGFSPFSDGATGVGGSGFVGRDEDVMVFGQENAPTIGHDDDIEHDVELTQWNIADAATHVTVFGRAWWFPRRHPQYPDVD